jgi:hypothetical protein
MGATAKVTLTSSSLAAMANRDRGNEQYDERQKQRRQQAVNSLQVCRMLIIYCVQKP